MSKDQKRIKELEIAIAKLEGELKAYKDINDQRMKTPALSGQCRYFLIK